MDRRSWPWKKKIGDKSEKDTILVASSLTSNPSQKENNRKPSYVQISLESYTHFTTLEDQIKSADSQIHILEEQIQDLHEKLATAEADINVKEELVKQHAKVAEEAVSGWEKAEAEALSLKTQSESLSISKLASEDRASELDSALKECMRQIRSMKEDHEKALQEVIFTKNNQFDTMKQDLESRIAVLDEDIAIAVAENAAVSRALQERATVLINISEEKSQAEMQIERLQLDIESYEREVNSLKYELHVASKELEIRTEEKNMSIRSAEVANKQQSESGKKVVKLEAECQRLRGLVRKKLPGPAALAQMKMEVESVGDPRRRQSLDVIHKVNRETEFLTERILAMEEETKMLKEALASRNSELLLSRTSCAKAESRLRYLETQLENNQHGNDNHLKLMDDFLEMEKLANSDAVNVRTCVNKIHDFVLSLGKESELKIVVGKFSAIVAAENLNLEELLVALSDVLAKASDLRVNISCETDDCIDKVALPENKDDKEDASSGERYENACAEFPDDGNSEWKSEKESMTSDLAKYSENLDRTTKQLRETEEQLAEVKSQLAEATKSNGLSETQLKCMAESYRALEARALDLESEVSDLKVRADNLARELQIEQKTHRDTLVRLEGLEEQLKKSDNDVDLKVKQDRGLTATAEKLAECQETILTLGKQLKAMHSQHDTAREELPAQNGKVEKNGDENNGSSEPELCTTPTKRSPISFRNASHGVTQSPAPEKHRGFSRFFSPKVK